MVKLNIKYNTSKVAINILEHGELENLINLYFNVSSKNQKLYCNGKRIITLSQFNELKDNDEIIVKSTGNCAELESHISRLSKDFITVNTLLHIKCKHGCYEFAGIIDTGAQASIMNENMVKLLNLDNMVNRSDSVPMVGVGGISYTMGSIKTDIKIDDQINIPFKFNIHDVQEKDYFVLFGLDFLKTYNCKLNLDEMALEIYNHKLKLMNEYEISYLKEPTKFIDYELSEKYKSIKKNKKLHQLVRNIIVNILKNPNNKKYQMISKTSNVLNNAINENPNIIELLECIGFKDNGDKFILNDLSIINNKKNVLLAN